MSSADNVALYRRFIEEFDRPEVVDELLVPGIELPTLEGTAEPTADGLKQLRKAFLAAFPDLEAELEIVRFQDGRIVDLRSAFDGEALTRQLTS